MSTVRGSSLRARLTRTLVGLGLVSVLMLAAVNFFVVRDMLDGGTRDQLVAVRDLRRDSIERSIERLLTRVSVVGGDAGVADALADLRSGYQQIDDDLTDTQLDSVESSYADVVGRYDDAGVGRPAVSELVPASVAGRYVQYHYVASQPVDRRAEIVDAGDGSEYSAAHAEHHEFLRELAASVGASDLVLVDATTAEVVYSVEKHIDIGTDAASGPYAETGLGETWESLGIAAVTDSVLGDSEFYLPSSAAPLAHVAANVRAGTEVLGAVVMTIDTAVLTTMVSAGQQWELLGLGDTGEAYLVGTDLTMRTVPRPWFDDPSDYIDRFEDAGGDDRIGSLMSFTGSPVLLQTVDNAAVRAALDGDEFVGTVDNYFGEGTIAATTPITAGDLGWVMVTEQHSSETRDELEQFAISIAILLAVLLPLLAVVGILLARVLARPIRPLVDKAGRIADGDYDTDVPDLGPTELGDVGRQLQAVANDLKAQEVAIAAEEDRIMTMLSSVLPPALVELVRRGDRELGDVVDTGTVIAVKVRGLPEASEQDVLADLVARATDEFTVLADRFGVERARVSPELLIFVAGRGMVEYDASRAAGFAVEAVTAVERVGSDVGLSLTGHGGLALGLVATGLLGSQQVTFGVWGDCVARAADLCRIAGAGEVLADGHVVDELDDGWDASSAGDDRGWGAPDDEAFAIDRRAVAAAVRPDA